MKSADPQGLGRVYREHAATLWRALVAYTGDREVADDALAEASTRSTSNTNRHGTDAAEAITTLSSLQADDCALTCWPRATSVAL